MNLHRIILITFILELCWCYVLSIKWLTLMIAPKVSTNITSTPVIGHEMCDLVDGLVKRQRQICKRNFDMMGSVGNGGKLAIDECHYQFQMRRWNCSTTHGLAQGTREAAFVHALTAAGVAHEVTKACSSGSLDKCGCDRTVRGHSSKGFEWAGCSDNVAFGNAFSRTFVDVRERAKGSGASKALMNLHNNRAGRLVLEKNMRVMCKCHGVSGSCELKTCWRAMPGFRNIGEILKEKFDGATEVTQKRVGSRKMLVPMNTEFKPHKESDLVYLVSSPDFCDADSKSGSLGTTGRLCNKTSKAIDGCDLMCCGRGYKSRKRIVEERCHCKFMWCCKVKCQTCFFEREESRCM